jgi:hypothetical protein
MAEGLTCPNCGAAGGGKYCPGCGQRQGVVRASIARIIRDVLEDQLSLNGTLPRTLAALLVRPGALTQEYMSLRIARYVPPVRLYLVSSVLFFLLVRILSPVERPDFSNNPQADSVLASVLDSLRAAQPAAKAAQPQPGGGSRFLGVHLTDLTPGTRWADNLEINLGNAHLNEAVRTRLNELGHLPPREAFRIVAREFLDQVPTVMFIMLPVYALLLKILYIRRRRFYVEHFIFALHVHALTFVLFLLALLLRSVPVLPGLLLAWLPMYTLIAMKRVYGQGWFKTGAKWFVLGNVYIMVLGFGALLGFVLAIAAV